MRRFLSKLGPGLITGASDDDPSGIGTYSETGARFGFTYLWLALFTIPMMVAIQELCARIGLVTGEGIAGVIRKHYRRWVLYTAVALLVIANTINIGADLGAMGAATHLILGQSWLLWTVLFAVLTAFLEICLPYKRYVKILKWLTLSLFAYMIAPFFFHIYWDKVLLRTFIPTISGGKDAVMVVLAVFGTTISPYLFFWNANQEVEEEIGSGKKTLAARRGVTSSEIETMRADVTIGMVFSNLVTFFIILTTAVTLNAAGITSVHTAQEAAEALQPFGQFAGLLFTLGIVGTGLLAIPVLAGSAAYALAETFKWKEGLSLNWRKAKLFYGVILAATLIGLLINLIGINPIRMLLYTAVINGLIAAPLIFLIIRISSNPSVMGKHVAQKPEKTIAWLTFLVMAILSVALVWGFVV